MAIGDSERSAWIDILRCVGAVLITNSHFDLIYPNAAFSVGGQLGNAIFFFAAGYTTTYSIDHRPRRFFPWYLSRLSSLYVPTWIALSLATILTFDKIGPAIDIAMTVLFPVEFWFVPAISILYCIVFFFSSRSTVLIFVATLVLIFSYVAIGLEYPDNARHWIENDIWVKSIGYGGCMLLGSTYSRLQLKSGSRPWILASIAAALLAAYAALMLGMRMTSDYTWQFAGMLLAILFTLFLSLSLAGVTVRGIADRIVKLVSPLTLYIYLVQVPILNHLPWQHLPFPVRVVVALLAIGVSAFALRYASNHILAFFRPRQTVTTQ